jgi:hypothetical protein
LLGLRKGR